MIVMCIGMDTWIWMWVSWMTVACWQVGGMGYVCPNKNLLWITRHP